MSGLLTSGLVKPTVGGGGGGTDPALISQQGAIGTGALFSSFSSSAMTIASSTEAIIVTFSRQSGSQTLTGISGCGATWTLVKQQAMGGSGTNTNCYMWIGTTPTPGSGTVTVTWSGTIRGKMWVGRFSGLTGTVLETVGQASGSNVLTFAGNTFIPANPGSGLLVTTIGNQNSDSTNETNRTLTPGTGWVHGTSGVEVARAMNLTSYRIGADIVNADQHIADSQGFGANWAAITTHFQAA